MSILKQKIRIAILDLYNGTTNEGMRCIKQLVSSFQEEIRQPVDCQIFDVRVREEVPDLNFHMYISTGGPGNPMESIGSAWEKKYFDLMDALRAHNESFPERAKHVLLICHSFQVYCRYYGFAQVSERKSMSFGVMPVHKTMDGINDPLLQNLSDPFWAVDSREYQILKPDLNKIEKTGAKILCIEKIRPHVRYERALMGIRFNEFMIGLQFHPEADAEGMKMYFQREDKKALVIKKHGEKKYRDMLEHLDDPDKILETYRTIIPTFLKRGSPVGQKAVAS